MSDIKRNLPKKTQTIVNAGQSIQSGIQLNANPKLSRVFDTNDNLLAELQPGDEYTCPATGDVLPPVNVECTPTDVVPAWAVLQNTGWTTVIEADYFAFLTDIAFVAVLLDQEP